MIVSASTLALWMECPLKAKRTKLEGRPTRQNAKASFGTCIHHALDLYNQTGDVELAKATFLDVWQFPEKLGVAPDYWPRMMSWGSLKNQGLEALQAFHENIKWDTREVLFTEHPFLVPFGRHQLKGIVDMGELRKSGKGELLLRVVDFKAQPLNTPTLTPVGWVKFGDLKVGDQVVGSNGHPTMVEGVYPQGFCQLVRIHFSDGTTVECSPDHLWSVRDLYGKDRVLAVRAFLPLRKGLNHRYSVPTVQPVQFAPGNPLPIDPYVLGVLIGDGGLTNSAVKFTKPDPVLVGRVADRLPPGHELHVLDQESGLCSIVGSSKGPGRNAVLNALRALGLMVGSLERFIPEVYLYASVQDRLDLLAGLMDADGSSSNRIQFRTGSPRLRDDFVELCRSLGGVPRWSASQSYYTDEGGRHECAESYHMTPGVPFNPFGVSTKGANWKPPINRQNRWITNIEWLDHEVEMQCIKVAAPDGLYVTDGFVLTHNTNSRAPSRAELTQNTQFTVYVFASQQPEFWMGVDGNPDYPGLPNGEMLYSLYNDLPRRAIWWHLLGPKELDAGPRDDSDYMRLYRLIDEVEKAMERDVFVPRIGESSCSICDFTAECGLRIPTREEELEDPHAWI